MMLDQYKNPEAKQQYLQSWLAQEILYRQALKEQLTEKPEVKKLIDRLMQGALSQYVMNRELASKINITDTDLQTYYTANKGKFVEPAKATINHILVDDEQQAKDLIGRIQKGEGFSELAKQFSKDENTKQSGGKIESDVLKGAYVAGIGDYSDLSDKIFAVSAPAVLDEPFKTENGWEIIKVETVTAEKQKDLDEVRQQVMRMLANQKSQDVQRDYIEQLKNEYDVVIHSSAFLGPKENDAEQAPQATK
jgi:parvulin-like peptidyl-prolyl isomerase